MRRRGQRIWSYAAKVYVPCPLRLKCDFMRAAREENMTQAEFGLMIIEEAMCDRQRLAMTVKRYRSGGGMSDA